jgi:hypothetical protein
MRNTLATLSESLAAISLDDPLDQNCFDALEDARAKMRMIDIWMRGPPLMPADASAGAGARQRGGSGRPTREPDLSF